MEGIHNHNSQLNHASARRFRRRWGRIYTVVLICYVLWTLLDAFVIPRDIIASGDTGQADTDIALSQDTGETPDGLEETPSQSAPSAPVITDTSYDDDQISIDISTVRILNTTVYIADITISDPSYLRTALAHDLFGRNVTDTTSNMAEQNNAILAINGDYYGFRSSGYVMRHGYVYRYVPADDPDQEDLVIYEDGSLEIIREARVKAQTLEEETDATDILSFGPALVLDGEVSVDADDEVDRAQVTNPRTAIGLIEPLHYLFVVSDGRTKESKGLSLLELAQFMQDLGCSLAYNLDGGGSSTMYFNGRILNRPTTFGDKIAERTLSDIIYIGKD